MPLQFEKKASSLYRLSRDGQHIGCLEQSGVDLKFFLEIATDPDELVEKLSQQELAQILTKLEELNGSVEREAFRKWYKLHTGLDCVWNNHRFDDTEAQLAWCAWYASTRYK